MALLSSYRSIKVFITPTVCFKILYGRAFIAQEWHQMDSPEEQSPRAICRTGTAQTAAPSPSATSLISGRASSGGRGHPRVRVSSEKPTSGPPAEVVDLETYLTHLHGASTENWALGSFLKHLLS